MYNLKRFESNCSHYYNQDQGVIYYVFFAFSVMNGGKIFHESNFSDLDLRLLYQLWKLEFQNIMGCVTLENNMAMPKILLQHVSAGGNTVV
jgi:hypothetical protein